MSNGERGPLDRYMENWTGGDIQLIRDNPHGNRRYLVIRSDILGVKSGRRILMSHRKRSPVSFLGTTEVGR